MNNLSAFPQHTVYMAPNGAIQQQGPQGGMTLRDYFAAGIMQGLCANFGEGVVPETMDGFARVSYKIADAMIKARSA